MKLLFSSFLCYHYLASSTLSNSDGSSHRHYAWAFAPPPSSQHLHRHHHHRMYQQQYQQPQRQSSLSMIGLHDQPATPSSSSSSPENDELLRKKKMASQQVMKEVALVKEYLAWLISSNNSDVIGSGNSDGGSLGAATFGDMIAAVASGSGGDMVELLGGSNDVTSTSSSSTSSSSSSSSSKSPTEYLPSYRSDLGNTILLSGTTDPTLLQYLNNNFFGQSILPNFSFDTIKAVVSDVVSAKKGAISREARYGGLLDKLVIEPLSSSSSSVLPTQEEMGGASSWIVQLSSSSPSLVSMMTEVAQLASSSSTLKNVIVMVVSDKDDNDDSHASSAAAVLEGWNTILEASGGDNGSNFKATLLSVGKLYDGGNEGGFYHIGPLVTGTTGTTAALSTASTTATPATTPSKQLSRKKAYQLLAHALALDSTAQHAYVAYEYSTSDAAMMEAIASPVAEGDFALRDEEEKELVDEYKDVKMTCRMIQAMREVGFTQVMELDVLVGKGIESYTEYIANPPNRENVFSAFTPARDEENERIMKMLEEESEKNQSVMTENQEEEKKIAIEGIAKEWAIKEYTLRMLNGIIDDSLSENEFVESVWDEALAEGAKTYELITSEEYKRSKEKSQKSMTEIGQKLFWDDMPPLLRKKREKMVEKVKQQYMDLLSEEELEKIILMSE